MTTLHSIGKSILKALRWKGPTKDEEEEGTGVEGEVTGIQADAEQPENVGDQVWLPGDAIVTTGDGGATSILHEPGTPVKSERLSVHFGSDIFEPRSDVEGEFSGMTSLQVPGYGDFPGDGSGPSSGNSSPDPHGGDSGFYLPGGSPSGSSMDLERDPDSQSAKSDGGGGCSTEGSPTTSKKRRWGPFMRPRPGSAKSLDRASRGNDSKKGKKKFFSHVRSFSFGHHHKLRGQSESENPSGVAPPLNTPSTSNPGILDPVPMINTPLNTPLNTPPIITTPPPFDFNTLPGVNNTPPGQRSPGKAPRIGMLNPHQFVWEIEDDVFTDENNSAAGNQQVQILFLFCRP